MAYKNKGSHLDHLGDHVHVTVEGSQLTTSSSGRCRLSNVLIDTSLAAHKLLHQVISFELETITCTMNYAGLCRKCTSHYHYHRRSIKTVDCCGECAQWVVGGSVTRDCGAPVLIESPFL